MKVLVSSCILGRNCKYNGGNNFNSKIIKFLENKEVIEICSELLANMTIPRSSAEIVKGAVRDIDGNGVDAGYQKAVQLVLEKIDLVILQSRSPTCGVNQIYDGSFTNELLAGQGPYSGRI